MTQVLDNTVIDTVYFTSYLFYLYFIRESEQMMNWIEALTFLRVKPEVEFFGHYSHMMQRIKDLQTGVDDSEDNRQMIADIGEHLATCPTSHVKDAAEFAQLMLSKHVLKDRGLTEISEGAAKLIESNPDKFRPLFAGAAQKASS